MRRALPLSIALLAVCVPIAACSTEFDPRVDSEFYYSMWGTLDASADTQWVRIGPVRASVDPSSTPLDADVSLLRLATGGRAPFRNALLTFGTGLTAPTSWTVAPVAPGETYRIDVMGPDGAETRATVRVPNDYPTPALTDGACSCPTRVTVSGVERLVDVVAIYRNVETGAIRRFSKRTSIRRQPDGTWTADAYFGDDAVAMGADPFAPGAFEATLLVANGTEDWPEGTLDPEDPETSVLLGDSDQIENGLGFVGGTVTKRLPFTPGFAVCPLPFGAPPEPCFERPNP